MSLPELDLVPLLQSDKLPPHKGVIVRVGICGDEGTPPVHLGRKEGQWESLSRVHYQGVIFCWGGQMDGCSGVFKEENSKRTSFSFADPYQQMSLRLFLFGGGGGGVMGVPLSLLPPLPMQLVL